MTQETKLRGRHFQAEGIAGAKTPPPLPPQDRNKLDVFKGQTEGRLSGRSAGEGCLLVVGMPTEGWVRADGAGEPFGFHLQWEAVEVWSYFTEGEAEHLSALGPSCEVVLE